MCHRYCLEWGGVWLLLTFCEQATVWDNDICLVLLSTVAQYTGMFFHSFTPNDTTVHGLSERIIGTNQFFYLGMKQRIHIVELLVWPDTVLNWLSTSFDASTRTLTPARRFVDMYFLYYFITMTIVLMWYLLNKVRTKQYRLKFISVLFFTDFKH